MEAMPTGSQDLDAPPHGAPGSLRGPRHLRAPEWLQLVTIAGLLGSAFFVGSQGRYLWCTLLAIAGIAFGLAFLLRRMIGDQYDRM